MKAKLSPSALPGKNPLKELLRKGQSAIGVVVTVNNVEVAARLAALGFDFLWLETEHSPLSLETIRNIVLATRGLPAVLLARPPVNELWTAKRLLDMGVLGVIFPFTSSLELARRAVAACRYPPTGLRGSGADLARLRWPEAANYYDFADESVLVVAMIEDVEGLSSIDEIAAVPGIDVLFIGTSDLSFSLGLRGEQHHPRLEAAVARITAAAKRHGKVLGRPGRTPEEVRRFQARGFRFFMTGSELDLLEAGARQFFKSLNRR
ncbi:MAG: HpcH/HpaI aldolase family protein [Limisphaerales bacterium]